MTGRPLQILYTFLGVLSLLVLACMLATGPLLEQGLLRPLAHQRLGYIGVPVALIFVGWTLLRSWRKT